MKALAVGLIMCGAGSALADAGNPYFHAIYCKAVWSGLSADERARVAGSDAAIEAISNVLQGYVGSGTKTARTIEADVADLKAYSRVEAHRLKDWRACVAYYAPDAAAD